MATALEQAFIAATGAALATRQTTKDAALKTYAATGFTPAARATFITASVAADVAYAVSLNTAATTAGISPFCVDTLPGTFFGTTAAITAPI
jgi:hypothetical protein